MTTSPNRFLDRRTSNHDCETETGCCSTCRTHDGCSCDASADLDLDVLADGALTPDRQQLWWLESFLAINDTTPAHRERQQRLSKYLHKTCDHSWSDVSGWAGCKPGTHQCDHCNKVVSRKELDALRAALAPTPEAEQEGATDGDRLRALRDALWEGFSLSERLEGCTRHDASALADHLTAKGYRTEQEGAE